MDDISENQIIWQKWRDPFGEDDISEGAFDPYLGNYSEDNDNIEAEYEDDKVENIFDKIQKNSITQIKVISTPMGVIPVTENTASGKIFNFWIGHTNFDITKSIALLIEQIPGVETLDIFTRYRFRIAVGKAFDDSSVMRDINNKVYREINNG
jgi:hypothetical protein